MTAGPWNEPAAPERVMPLAAWVAASCRASPASLRRWPSGRWRRRSSPTLRVIPSPLAVVAQLWADRATYPLNVWHDASRGAARLFLGQPRRDPARGPLRRVPGRRAAALLKLAIASYCIPLVAIAPILVVVLPATGRRWRWRRWRSSSPRWSRRYLGLRSMDAVHVDLIRSTGGGPWKIFRLVRVAWAPCRASLPGCALPLRRRCWAR